MRYQHKKQRAWISLLVTALLLFDTAYSVFAVSDRELMDLKSFGIVAGDENGDLGLENTITRAEVAKITAYLLRVNEAATSVSQQQIFSDLDSTHWASGYIAMLYEMGIVSGADDGCFYPDNEIKYEEAIKLLTTALGYADQAEEMGGYPGGYIAVAGKIGLLKGASVKSGEAAVRGEVFTMVYNTLDAPRMVEMLFAGEKEYLVSDRTIRDMFLGDTDDGLAKIRCVVEADYYRYLYSASDSIKKAQVMANGTLFDVGNTNAADYLGQEVDIYAKISAEDANYRILNVLPTTNNFVFEVNMEDLVSFDETQISFSDESGKKRKYQIESTAVFVKNGRPVKFNEIDVSSFRNGSVKFVSNDGDNAADVIIIDSYVSAEIDSLNVEQQYLILDDDVRVNGQKKISFTEDSLDQTRCLIQDESGNEISYADLAEGDIVSIFASKDGEFLKIVKGKGEFTGDITEKTSNVLTYLTIDETEYPVEYGVDCEGLLGETVCVKLNFEGKIYKIERAGGAVLYGAILGVEPNNAFSSDCIVKLVTAGNIKDVEEEEDDPDEEAEIALQAKNKSVEILPLAQKINIDGVTYKGEDVKKAIEDKIRFSGKGYFLAEYQLNNAGQLYRFILPEEIGTAYAKVYNSKERTFGKTIGGAFGVCDDTLVICIPKSESPNDNDYLVKIKMNDGQSYNVSAFDYNDDTHCAGLIVINEEMNASTSGNITSKSKTGLVFHNRLTVNAEGEIIRKIGILTEDGEVVYDVSDNTMSNADFDGLRAGDLILYSYDTEDKLDGFNLVVHSDPLPDSRTETTINIGKITNAEFDIVSETLNRWVDTLTIRTDSGAEKTFEVRKNGTPPIYVYDLRTGIAKQGTSLDFLSEHKMAVVTMNSTAVRAILIIQ